jgi:hypothetical protein
LVIPAMFPPLNLLDCEIPGQRRLITPSVRRKGHGPKSRYQLLRNRRTRNSRNRNGPVGAHSEWGSAPNSHLNMVGNTVTMSGSPSIRARRSDSSAAVSAAGAKVTPSRLEA